MKHLIWQACFDDGPRYTHRALASQLGVRPSYVCKVQKESAQGLDALAEGTRVTLDDLDDARHFSARLRELGAGLLRTVDSSGFGKARALTEDEIIAKNWREVAQLRGKS